MASWPTKPAWRDIAIINNGNTFLPADGLVADDVNAIVNNLLYLYEISNEISKQAAPISLDAIAGKLPPVTSVGVQATIDTRNIVSNILMRNIPVKFLVSTESGVYPVDSMLSVANVANEENIPEDAIYVYNYTQLVEAAASGKDVILMADMDLINTTTSIETCAGKLYGNGHTLHNVNCPLFDKLTNNVSSLNIKGNISGGSDMLSHGVLANKVPNGADIIVRGVNIAADVTYKNAVCLGGFVGSIDTNARAQFSECTYAGHILVQNGTYIEGVGGFVGRLANNTVTILDHCSVSGSVGGRGISKDNVGVGGFVGQGLANSHLTTEYCVNYAAVEGASGDGGAAGIYGNTTWESSSKGYNFTARFCVNYGNIAIYSGRGRAGGIAGRLSKYGNIYRIEYCYNVGAITGATDSASGILGYSNTPALTIIRGCFNSGDLKNAYQVYPIGGSGAQIHVVSENNYFYGTSTNNNREDIAATQADTWGQLYFYMRNLPQSPYVYGVRNGDTDATLYLRWEDIPENIDIHCVAPIYINKKVLYAIFRIRTSQIQAHISNT